MARPRPVLVARALPRPVAGRAWTSSAGRAPMPGGLAYRVYRNDGAGGPVDYASPIAVTKALAFSPPALAVSTDTTFAVRAVDLASGLEEANRDARVRVVVDGAGVDVTARPNAPSALAATPKAGGTALATWAYNARGQGGAPTQFKVWLTAGGTVNYAAAPAATVAYAAGVPTFSETLSGLADGATYAIGVRATNAAGDEPNTSAVTITGEAAGPAAVEALAASSTSSA